MIKNFAVTKHCYNRFEKRFGIKNEIYIRNIIRKAMSEGENKFHTIKYKEFILKYKKRENLYLFLTVIRNEEIKGK